MLTISKMFKFLSNLAVWEYYYKSVYQPILTRENSEHPDNFQNKSVSSAILLSKMKSLFSACKRKFLESTSQFSF